MTDLDIAESYDDDPEFTPEQKAEADRLAREILQGNKPEPSGNRAQRRAEEKAAKRGSAADKAQPVEREASGISVIPVSFDGETYWVPADVLDWDPEALLAFERKQAMSALQGILEPQEDGTEGFAHFLAVKRRKGYRMRQVNELYESIAKAGGFRSAGN